MHQIRPSASLTFTPPPSLGRREACGIARLKLLSCIEVDSMSADILCIEAARLTTSRGSRASYHSSPPRPVGGGAVTLARIFEARIFEDRLNSRRGHDQGFVPAALGVAGPISVDSPAAPDLAFRTVAGILDALSPFIEVTSTHRALGSFTMANQC